MDDGDDDAGAGAWDDELQEEHQKTHKEPKTILIQILPRVDNVVNGIMQTEETSSESCPEVVRRDLASQKTSSNSCPAAPKVH